MLVFCVLALMAGFFGWKRLHQPRESQLILNESIEKISDEAKVVEEKKAALDEEKTKVVEQAVVVEKKEEAEKQQSQLQKVPIEKKVPVASGKVVSALASWGFQKSAGRTIKAIIVHTSYNALGGDVFDFDKVIQEWKDAGVSPHYAIDRAGTIFQLVADQNIAWHAGVSKLPDGTIDVNGASIGIEVINSQDSKFSNQQYDSLNWLIEKIKSKYEIKYVLGHDQIAAGRKTDPWGIAWNKVSR